MKLTLSSGPALLQGDVILPDSMLWEDEFLWVPSALVKTYALQGSLLVETSTKQAGRPINLRPSADDMSWVTRDVVEKLYAWASLENIEFTLTLEYPEDTRTFQVMFDPEGGQAMTASPVKGFSSHSQDDWFIVKLKLFEV